MIKTIVRDLMSTEPVCARPDMPLTELVKLLADYSVRGVPVVDGKDQLLGVVTETDLFLKERGIPFSLEKAPTLLGEFVDPEQVEKLEACRSVTVGDVMTTAAVTVDVDATLWDAAKLMSERRLSLLPVLDGQRWVGTVRRIAILSRIYHS